MNAIEQDDRREFAVFSGQKREDGVFLRLSGVRKDWTCWAASLTDLNRHLVAADIAGTVGYNDIPELVSEFPVGRGRKPIDAAMTAIDAYEVAQLDPLKRLAMEPGYLAVCSAVQLSRTDQAIAV